MQRINVLKYFWSIIVLQLILVFLFVGSMAVQKESGENRTRLPVKEVALPLRIERDPEPPVPRLNDAAQPASVSPPHDSITPPARAELAALATSPDGQNSRTLCEMHMETAMRSVDRVVQHFWGNEQETLEALFGRNIKKQWDAVKKECWKVTP